MIPRPRPSLRLTDCTWCGNAPPCCPESRVHAEEQGRALARSLASAVVRLRAKAEVAGLLRQRTVADDVARERRAYGGGPQAP